ncbi:hypothetical protein GV828_04900 [Flavobacterium sp. NST-5]|uniref:Outer membrane protein beta-barrel domain-containing protein n=1 Tax=Flavobacterium ichthyis TaxID=2698827 RepID=A0ABW9Z7J4_9FLAO|nr:hypothetical protein [Flavobacterium ichthyis]NBL64537.1 hypothetical protein [Flavobacterium ichthyis]
MKNLKQLTSAFAVCFALFTTNVQAQDALPADVTENYDSGFRLGFGLNTGYVFEDPYGFALGGDVRLQYDFNRRYSVTLTTGFTNMFVPGDDLGFIPAKAGFKAFVWEDRFYILGEAGAAFAVTNDYNETSLLLAPGIGYANKYFDASIRYEHYNNFPTADGNEGVGQIALRLAYGFRL